MPFVHYGQGSISANDASEMAAYPCFRAESSELTVDLRFFRTKSYLSLSSEPPPLTGHKCLRHAAPVVQLSYWSYSHLRATHALYLGSTSIAWQHPSISAAQHSQITLCYLERLLSLASSSALSPYAHPIAGTQGNGLVCQIWL